MSSVRFDRQRMVLLGFLCVMVIYELTYRLGKSREILELDTARLLCVSQLKVAEEHNHRLNDKYKTLEKQSKEENEKQTSEMSKIKAELEAQKASHAREVNSLQEEIANMKKVQEKSVETLVQVKRDCEDETIILQEKNNKLTESELELKDELETLKFQLAGAHQKIGMLEKESAALQAKSKVVPVVTPKHSNNVLLQPQVENKPLLLPLINKPILPKPIGKILPPIANHDDDTMPKPQLSPDLQNKAQKPDLEAPIKAPSLNDKAESYNQMAFKLSNKADEEHAEVAKKHKVEPEFDNGEQLKKMNPNLADEKMNLQKPGDVKDENDEVKRKKLSNKLDEDFVNDDDNPEQYDDAGGENRPDEDKGFDREGHIEEPVNDLGINNEVNEVRDRVMLNPK